MTPSVRQAIFNALVNVFAAGCDVDRCLSEVDDDNDPAASFCASVTIAAEKIDEAQDALLSASGVSLDDVRQAYLNRLLMNRKNR
jgi:hypothetical protein